MSKPRAQQAPLFPVERKGASPDEALDNAKRLAAKGARFVLSTSGGKDSQEMLRHVVGLFGAGAVLAVIADLGEMEWPDAIDHARSTCDALGVELRVVKPPRTLLESIERRGMWPSRRARYCTSDHKRGPIDKVLRAAIVRDAITREVPGVVISCSGERWSENNHPNLAICARESCRCKLITWEREYRLGSSWRLVYRWRPILHWSEAEVWDGINASGLPAHPIYAKGARRLSCSFCVFGSLPDLRLAKELRPDFYQKLVKLEARMGHSFKDGSRTGFDSLTSTPPKTTATPAPSEENPMNDKKPDGIIHLHGRNYKTVALRVQEFREKCPLSEGWGLITQPITVEGDLVVFRAAVVNPAGREIAVGYAEEKRSPKGINSTSALENAETSAIGRALAAAGFGGTEYASADELVSALNQQKENEKPKAHHASWAKDHRRFLAEMKSRGLLYEDVAGWCEKKGWQRPSTWTTEERSRWLEDLDGGAFQELFDPAKKPAAEVAGG